MSLGYNRPLYLLPFDYCRSTDQLFMFELPVPATKAQMDRVHADQQTYDLRIRPELTLQTIRTLQDAGVEPDVWKIEGLDRREDCERVVETARRGGRDDVGCIVLGRGANEKKVAGWLGPPRRCQASSGSPSGARRSGMRWPTTSRTRRADKRPWPVWHIATDSG